MPFRTIRLRPGERLATGLAWAALLGMLPAGTAALAAPEAGVNASTTASTKAWKPTAKRPVSKPSANRTAGPRGTTRPRFVVRPVDGGPRYYGRFADPLPSSDTYFPLGVWLQSVRTPQEAALDAAAGINTYVGLTAGSDLAVVRAQGMSAIVQHDFTGATGNPSGWLISDEADMWAGPGDGPWSGKWPDKGPVCLTGSTDCGYSVQRRINELLPDRRRVRWSNYGKGVLLWQSAAQAARFVNEFQDIVSVDAYWLTDNNLCGTWEGGRFLYPEAPRTLTSAECHRPANYGATVERVRRLVSPAGSKPVWAFVELGHPFGNQDWPTAGVAQIDDAVWSSIIHGARGITYFNHSFGGRCVSHHILRDPCYANVRKTVTSLNARITALAPILNSPTVAGFVAPTPGVDTMVKTRSKGLTLFAQATSPRAATSRSVRTITMKCRFSGAATVVGEGRTVPVTAGRLRDRFPVGAATHVYRLPASTVGCGVA